MNERLREAAFALGVSLEALSRSVQMACNALQECWQPLGEMSVATRALEKLKKDG